MIVLIGDDANSGGVDYIAKYLSMLASEECDQIFFTKFVVIFFQSFHTLILAHSFSI
jgi:hypothetical protein